MALNNGINPKVKGFNFEPVLLTADDSDSTLNAIPAGASVVHVVGVTNDADDYVFLPPVSSVQNGFEITLLCEAGANFELRTPATSAEEINSEDCDGTKEYLCTDTQSVKIIKIDNTIGWMAHGYTVLGAVAPAVVPD